MRRTAAGVLALSVAACSCVWAALPVSRTGEVQVGGGSRSIELPETPLKNLASALRRDKKTSQFRVNWYGMAPHWRYEATAVYDRRRDTIIYDDVNHFSVDEENNLWKMERKTYLYRGVSDKIIYRLLALSRNLDPNGDAAQEAYFSGLTRFGCTRRRLRHTVKTETLK